MMEKNFEAILQALGKTVLASSTAFNELTLVVSRDSILDTLTKLRDDPACKFEILIEKIPR